MAKNFHDPSTQTGLSPEEERSIRIHLKILLVAFFPLCFMGYFIFDVFGLVLAVTISFLVGAWILRKYPDIMDKLW